MKSFRLRFGVLFFAFLMLLSLASLAQAAYDGYIVCFKDAQAAERGKQLLDSLPKLLDDVQTEPLQTFCSDDTLFTVENEDVVTVLEAAGLLAYSEPDYYATLHTYDYSADSSFSRQWAHTVSGIQKAWSLGIYGNDVTVAVLDSGIYEHPDLAENLLPGVNFVRPDNSTPADPTDLIDNVGHGTKVAGIICAAANGQGIVGAAHRAKVLPLKVADSSNFKNSYIASALEKAMLSDVDVISMSFGYLSDTDVASRTIKRYIQNALDQNIIVVASAGNDGDDAVKGGMYSYPASYDGVISVGSISGFGGKIAISGTSQHNDKVTIAAPGVYVLTTTADGGYGNVNGTSFSAPYVAAVAALAKSADKNLTPEHFRQLLIQTADKSVLNGAERDDYFGYGVLDAGALLTALAKEQGTGFLSPIDRRTDGGTTAVYTNFSERENDYSLVAGLFSGARPLSFRVLTERVAVGQSTEFDISGFEKESGILRCYLLDAQLRPCSIIRQ